MRSSPLLASASLALVATSFPRLLPDAAAQLDVAASGRALLAEAGVTEAYDTLRARLGRCAELWRIQAASPHTLAILGDPLTGPARPAGRPRRRRRPLPAPRRR